MGEREGCESSLVPPLILELAVQDSHGFLSHFITVIFSIYLALQPKRQEPSPVQASHQVAESFKKRQKFIGCFEASPL